METKHTTGPWLTDDLVHSLNEKHGWFKYGDAQSNVSKQFAQDAIDMHERIRRAAPDLLEALESIVNSLTDDNYQIARAAIAKATGERG